MSIKNYADFVAALLEAGFSLGGSNADNIFALCAYDFTGTNPNPDIAWHTGNPETDPWEWRVRVLNERDDIAYAKVFFKKSGYITKAWYPYFLAARRGKLSFEDEYFSGTITQDAKRVYQVISENTPLPFHEIKGIAGFGKEDKSRFERAIAELQMRMYITMCGRQQKVSQVGAQYGWYSMVFCTVEHFFGKDMVDKAAHIPQQEAVEKITQRIYQLNPSADGKKIAKFIKGR